jgi:SAM-dependent methyltransferase
MAERHGIWRILANPLIYEAVQHVVGARRWLRRFAAETIRAKSGDRVLDVGCGPGALLGYLPAVTYIGVDRNEAHIEQARRTHGSRGRFICDDVVNFDAAEYAPVDIAVAIGLLHHVDDGTARQLLSALASTLAQGGRLITADPCFHAAQSPVIRAVVAMDRGQHVRRFDHYRELVAACMSGAQASLTTGHLPFPHAVCVVEGRNS